MSQTTLSLAKTTRPTLVRVLARESVGECIDNINAPAIWLSGPPGAGKSVTIADHYSRRGKPVLWYELDPGDADIASFFHYLRRTAIKHASNKSLELPPLPTGRQNWIAYGRKLLRAIFSGYAGELVIVFDCYDCLPAQALVHEVLAQVIAEVPRQSTMVLVSRGAPPPCFARQRIGGVLELVQADVLRVSAAELVALAELRQVRVDEAQRNHILALTEGWMAGIVMLLEHLRLEGSIDQLSTVAAGEVLLDFLSKEVFDSFDESMSEFLMKVCWCRELSPALAEKISGRDDAAAILANLARNNYFVSECGEQQELVYAVHPMLREFIGIEAGRRLGSNRRRQHRASAAEALAGAGYPEEAVELLAADSDWQGLQSLFQTHMPTLIAQGRTELALQWLNELPREYVDDDPWLTYYGAQANLLSSPRVARRGFAQAFRVFAAQDAQAPMKHGALQACAGQITAILREGDDFSLLDDCLAAIAERILENSEPELFEPIIDVVLLAAVLRYPAGIDIDLWFRRSESALERAPDDKRKIEFLLRVILARILRGDLEWAATLIGQAEAVLDDNAMPMAAGQLALLAAIIYLLRGQSQEASIALERARSALTASDSSALAIYVQAMQTVLCILRGEQQEAATTLQVLDTMRSSGDRSAAFIVHYIWAWYHVTMDDVPAALERQREAQSASSELGNLNAEILASTAIAQLLFQCDDKARGAAQLRRVHSLARDISNPILEFLSLLVYAELALAEGRISSGRNALRYALTLGRQRGFVLVPAWSSSALAALLEYALREHIEVSYVQSLIRNLGLQAQSPPVDLQTWPWALSIRSFGGFDISRDGQEDASLSASRGRPLELLKIILALGGRQVPANEVATLMWPHVDEEYAMKSFTINLHRLRKVLVIPDILNLVDGRLSLSSRSVMVDCLVFDQILNELLSTPAPDHEQMRRWQDALLGVYRGEFLAGVDEAWASSARTEYEIRFIQGLHRLADHWNQHALQNELQALFERLSSCLSEQQQSQLRERFQ